MSESSAKDKKAAKKKAKGLEGNDQMKGMQPPKFKAEASGKQNNANASTHGDPDLTPAEIREQYQASDDNVIDWTPKALGVEVPFAGSRRMTETEGEMLDGLVFQKGLVELFTFREIADLAFSESESRYPSPGAAPAYVPAGRENEWFGNDGHRDAFRHCYWNALLASEYGGEWASEYGGEWAGQFTTAHEGLPGNPAEREAMDLWNNEVGRKIAADNPRADADELAELVQAALDGGRLIVIDQSSNLAFSNTVNLWEHGLTGNATAAGNIPVPNGDASAKSG